MRRKTKTEERSFSEKQSLCHGGEAHKPHVRKNTTQDENEGTRLERQSQKTFIKLTRKVECDSKAITSPVLLCARGVSSGTV